MTDKALNEYYYKHKDTYMSLACNCTSVPEILLKLEIYGKKWSQWDWVLLFSSIISRMSHESIYLGVKQEDVDSVNALYRDIIETIDTTADFDKVMTSKHVVLSIIYMINSSGTLLSSIAVKTELNSLLAHVFKKFPLMWNMSWMKAKYRDPIAKKWTSYHRLKSSVHSSSHRTPDDPYYKSKKYYDDYMRLYYNEREADEKEDKEEVQ